MSTRKDPWLQGTPNWVDLGSPDPSASKAFYGALFGWEVVDTGPETGHYGMCTLGGLRVAGIGPQTGGGDGPASWLTYLAVDDVEKTAGAATAHGATIVAPPMPVGEAGKMAVLQDPAGVSLGLWQAGRTIGMERCNEPGAVVWNEHMSRDAERARAFYADVFGYTYTPIEGEEYWMFSVPGRDEDIGGIGALPADAPTDVAPHWMTYFEVPSADRSAAEAEQLGGTIAQAPFDTSYGRMAVVTDPHGAIFSIMSITPG
jgi:hypothetical protein